VPNYIASREFRACHPDRGEFTITLRIGVPFRSSDADWACPVQLEGLFETLRPQHGIDSWQALVLAQYLARTLLEGFVEDGGQIFDLDNEVADLERIFYVGI
jgi:hypothetical protein